MKGGNLIKNKLIYISIVILIFLSLTSVNATSYNKTDNDTVQIFEERMDVLSTTNGDFSTLSYEINASSHSNTFELTKDYTFNSESDGNYSQGIDITTDNLIIDGQGHTIDACNKARIFNIHSNNVVLKNIQISNGNANSHGGAIYWTGPNGSITDSIFKGCSSPNSGGAVLFKNSANIENTKFVDNTAYFGGGVGFESESDILNCTFENNFATFLGGGLYTYQHINIINSTFTNNTAGDGGGVYLESTGLVENSIFNKNYAIGYGGAITNEDEVTINNSEFKQNIGKFAGAIYIKGSAYIENNDFDENSAELGGAISSICNYATILNNNFNYNEAKQGSSLYINAKAVKIENNTFINENSSLESEIYISSKNQTLTNLTYQNITKPTSEETIIMNQTNVKPTVVKKKTTIKAKSKKFKLKTKSKKYTIILKAGKTPLKNKRIYLKLKGKTYVKKTNKKGKAIFKIKLRKKGKFKAIIIFKGDETYISSKKTVYIKINKK